MATLTSLSVNIELSQTTSAIVFTDLIADAYNTTYGYTLADVFGIIKITGSQTGVVYKNSGWDTDDYSLPDITSSAWSKTITSTVPIGQDGLIVRQFYTIEYKISVDNKVSTFLSFLEIFQNLYVSATVKITSKASLLDSTFVFTDSTVYDLTLGGNVYSPSSQTRNWTIVWPVGSGKNNTTSTASTLTLGPNIWSGFYTVTFYSTLTYLLVNSVNGLTVTASDKVVNAASDNRVVVVYNDFTNLVNQELIVITAQYEYYKLYNLPYAQQYQDILKDMMMYWDMFKMAYIENTDMGYAMTKIYDILQTWFLNITVVLNVTEILPNTATPSYQTFKLVPAIYTAKTDGQTTFNLPELVTGTILSATRGTQPQKVGVTGADLSYNNTTGDVIMVVPLSRGETIFFIIEKPI